MSKTADQLCSIAWILGHGERSGGHMYSPTWSKILEKLNELKEQSGTFRLEINAHKTDGKRLTAYSESGHYTMLFNDVVDGKQVLRITYDPTAPETMIDMPGDDWDARSAFYDFDLIYATFKEFYETGSVVSPRFSSGLL